MQLTNENELVTKQSKNELKHSSRRNSSRLVLHYLRTWRLQIIEAYPGPGYSICSHERIQGQLNTINQWFQLREAFQKV